MAAIPIFALLQPILSTVQPTPPASSRPQRRLGVCSPNRWFLPTRFQPVRSPLPMAMPWSTERPVDCSVAGSAPLHGSIRFHAQVRFDQLRQPSGAVSGSKAVSWGPGWTQHQRLDPPSGARQGAQIARILRHRSGSADHPWSWTSQYRPQSL